MSLMSISVEAAKRSFFDRPAVTRAVGKKKAKVFSKFGAYVRTRSRSSMRKARMKSLGEMTQGELISFEERKRYAAKNGLTPPKRPLAPSKPGEPPRVVLGLLKQFLYFAFDAKSESVVIGPAKLNGRTNAPEALEYGGQVTLPNGKTVTMQARPFMRPAFEAELPGVPALWAGALDGK